jgi:hypothetical protein
MCEEGEFADCWYFCSGYYKYQIVFGSYFLGEDIDIESVVCGVVEDEIGFIPLVLPSALVQGGSDAVDQVVGLPDTGH